MAESAVKVKKPKTVPSETIEAKRGTTRTSLQDDNTPRSTIQNVLREGTGSLFPTWITRSLDCAEEIKLWLTPSEKQRRNPCSGLPAVYPDLSMLHDWRVKKGLCFVCRDRQSG